MTGAIPFILFIAALYATYRGAMAAADWLDRRRG
jgi:hypothetical protein